MARDLAAYRTIGSSRARVTRRRPGVLWVKTERKVGEVFEVSAQGVPFSVVSRPAKDTFVVAADLSEEDLEAILWVDVIGEIDPTRGEHVMVPNTIGFGKRIRKVDAREGAVQRAVRWLLMEKGTDVWHPDAGGGLRTAFAGELIGKELEEVTKTVALAVEDYNSQSSSRSRSSGWSVTSIDVLSVRAIPAKGLQNDTGEPMIGISLRHKLHNKGETSLLETTMVF